MNAREFIENYHREDIHEDDDYILSFRRHNSHYNLPLMKLDTDDIEYLYNKYVQVAKYDLIKDMGGFMELIKKND